MNNFLSNAQSMVNAKWNRNAAAGNAYANSSETIIIGIISI